MPGFRPAIGLSPISIFVFRFSARDPRKSLERFPVQREANLDTSESLKPEARKQFGIHPERGEESIEVSPSSSPATTSTSTPVEVLVVTRRAEDGVHLVELRRNVSFRARGVVLPRAGATKREEREQSTKTSEKRKGPRNLPRPSLFEYFCSLCQLEAIYQNLFDE